MNTTTTERNIAALIAHIVSECRPVSPEESFAEFLDEQGDVDVCGLTFSPSQIWKEMDPTAFRCGVNDHADSMGWLEIESDYYESRDVENAREEFVDDLNAELSTLENELSDEEGAEEPDAAEVSRIQGEIKALEAFIKECENYAF